MRVFLTSLALALALLTACGGALGSEAGGGEVEEVDEGDAMAPPTPLTLPSLDVDRDSLSEGMLFGWELAEESFDFDRPPAPPSGATDDYQAWADEELATWIERKTTTVSAARGELDQAAEESLRQRIIAGALVGLMYESIGRALRSLPVPATIQTDREIAEVFRSILVSQARPYFGFATRAYDACRQNALGGPAGMRHWSDYCAARKDYLPVDE
ncbi:MAG: hypothetical protein DRJ42_04410 [Deltaproteobacteria bacterium]|nr:MAG: hypothetical protein DRJ42_04410 [Deltaproteobacteria bacterium]